MFFNHSCKNNRLIFIFLILTFGSESLFAQITHNNRRKLEKMLWKMEDVVSVRKIENDDKNIDENLKNNENFFCACYEIVFNQPLDWKNKSKGSFYQHVIFGFNDFDKNACVNLCGYSFSDESYTSNLTSDVDEIPRFFDCNFISIEHRFYGKSIPENLSTDSAELWENLSTFNAACDAHKIITEFKKIFTKKWIIYGISKGGYMTNLQSLYFPDDAQVFIPYVANCCNSPTDSRLYKFVYEEIGDDVFGKETAQIYRNILLNFQIWCMKNKEKLLPLLKQLNSENARFRDFLSDDILFEATVNEFAVNFWQYFPDFQSLYDFLQLPENSIAEQEFKARTASTFFEICSPEDLFSYKTDMLPYYIEAFTELGNYTLDFSYLQNAMFKNKVSECESFLGDENLYFDLILSPEQKQNLHYSDATYQALLNWVKTTENHVLMIYGGLDPWYSVRIPETAQNKNVLVYVNPLENHESCIESFSQEIRAEIICAVKEWLAE